MMPNNMKRELYWGGSMAHGGQTGRQDAAERDGATEQTSLPSKAANVLGRHSYNGE